MNVCTCIDLPIGELWRINVHAYGRTNIHLYILVYIIHGGTVTFPIRLASDRERERETERARERERESRKKRKHVYESKCVCIYVCGCIFVRMSM